MSKAIETFQATLLERCLGDSDRVASAKADARKALLKGTVGAVKEMKEKGHPLGVATVAVYLAQEEDK